MLARLFGGSPYSLSLHGPLGDYGPNQLHKWAHADGAIVITKRLRKEVETALGNSLPSLVSIAPMGVDVERFKRKAAFEPFRQSGDAVLRLFSCGRLNPCKGHHWAIEAMARLRDRGVSAQLRIAGGDDGYGGAYAEELEKLIVKFHLEESVTLLGPVGEEVVQRELESAHAFVLASVAEPLGVVVMEAMSYGVPVVATDAGGVAEIIEDDSYGWMCPARDAEALAGAIFQMAMSPDKASHVSRMSRDRVAALFHHRRSAEALLEIVAQVEAMSPGRSAFRLAGDVEPTRCDSRQFTC